VRVAVSKGSTPENCEGDLHEPITVITGRRKKICSTVNCTAIPAMSDAPPEKTSGDAPSCTREPGLSRFVHTGRRRSTIREVTSPLRSRPWPTPRRGYKGTIAGVDAAP